MEFPEITITHEDHAVLSSIVQQAMAKGNYAAASRLANEMHRARIVPASQAPVDCLVLNMSAQYMDEQSGAISDVVLVTGLAEAAIGTKSVLSRVGTALIGLSEGQRMGWADPRGRSRIVRLLKVRRTPGVHGLVP
jgi:transcription elongation GreA/GreB family factor